MGLWKTQVESRTAEVQGGVDLAGLIRDTY